MIGDLERIFGAKVIAKKSLRTWWFSSVEMTVFAECEDDVIVKTSPITLKFMRQHVKNLADWMRLQGGFEFKEIAQGFRRDSVDGGVGLTWE